MNVAAIQREENAIRIRNGVLYGDGLWFRVIHYQYFRRKMFPSSVSWKSISPLKTNTQGPDHMYLYWKSNILYTVSFLQFLRF